MTAWSLANIIIAPEVESLLDKNDSLGPEDARALPRDKALSVIHAALWAYGSRSDSTAGSYAASNFMEALGVKRWSFKDDWSDIKINGAAIAECLHKCEAERKALTADRDRLAKERDEAIRSLEQCREGRRIIATGAFDAGILTAISIGELEDAKADLSAAIARAERAEVERDDAAEQIHLLRGCLSADAQLLSAAIARAERAEAERDEAKRKLEGAQRETI